VLDQASVRVEGSDPDPNWHELPHLTRESAPAPLFTFSCHFRLAKSVYSFNLELQECTHIQ
jgi:hypothetical protein